MTLSHADNHDRDKLTRWHGDLLQCTGDDFPVIGVFVVSELDTVGHDIFRAFRSSFEKRNAGFEHVVIFGQHGVSETARRLLTTFGLPMDATPALALIMGQDSPMAYTIALPAGGEEDSDQEEDDQPWQQVLAEIEVASDMDATLLSLATIPDAVGHPLETTPLSKLIVALLEDF